MVLLSGVSSADMAKKRVQRLCDAIAQLADSDYFLHLPVSCSVGIALAPDEGSDYNILAQKADQRAYKIKQNGKNGCSF